MTFEVSVVVALFPTLLKGTEQCTVSVFVCVFASFSPRRAMIPLEDWNSGQAASFLDNVVRKAASWWLVGRVEVLGPGDARNEASGVSVSRRG